MQRVFKNTPPQGGAISPGASYQCRWEGERERGTETGERGAQPLRQLDLAFKAYSGGQEAHDAYASGAIPGRFSSAQKLKFTAVRGLGDEAGIIRSQQDTGEERAGGLETTSTLLRIRSRNVIVSLWLSSQRTGIDPALTGSLDGLSGQEEAAATVAREVLVRLGTAAASPPPKAPGQQTGEVRAPRPVCGASKTAEKTFGKGKDMTVTGDGTRQACRWRPNDGDERGLLLEAEAIAPSSLTGESGTTIAGSIYRDWSHVPDIYPFRGRLHDDVPGLGDDARMWTRQDTAPSSAKVYLRVRRGNLLVSLSLVEDPTKAGKDVEERARRMATEILESNP